MRSPSLHRRAFVRAGVLTLLVAGAIAVSAGPALASGPSALGVTGWQVYPTTAIYANPDTNQIHGDPGEYAAAPAIPGEDDPGWADCGPSSPLRSSPYASTLPLCPNPTTIGMGVGSILPGCWSGLNFTYFQALVSIPAGTDVSQFSVNMSGADDGARISLVNSAYPDGVTPPDGYIYQLTPQSTGNLAADVVAGEVNRVVITQVDDCASGNNLNSALISLNGTVVPPAPSDTTPPVDAPVVPAGWSNSDVTVNWNWTDGGSGVDSSKCTQSSTSAGEGAITLTSTCADLAGNTASDSVVVHVDKTAPTLSPSVSPNPVALGSSPIVSANASDSGSGLAGTNCGSVDTSSLGSFTVTCTATDEAGNSASATTTYEVSGRATKEAVLAGMKAAFAQANLPDRVGLGAAILAVSGSLTPRLWVDENHPASVLVFNGEQAAVVALDALLLDRHSSLADGQVQGWIDALVGEDRALASLAISDATGVSPRLLAAARSELALGDLEASHGHAAAAIGHYGLAWVSVQRHE